MAEAVYLYLEEADIPLKLEEERRIAEESGRIEESRQHEQVWDAVIQLLDEFVEMMGDERISFSLFQQMIETGLESLTFSLIPPALDQVFIGNMDLSRMYGIKCTFLIGANDGILPARPADDGVLTDDDREWLKRNGAALAATGREQLLDENYLIYMALSSPSHQLYVSYPIADAEGKTLLPSTIVKRLNELFPDHAEKMLANEPEQLDDEAQLEFLVNKSTALSYLAGQLGIWSRQYAISDVWWSTYNFLMDEPDRRFSQNVLSSLFFRNKVHTLNQRVSRELYGSTSRERVADGNVQSLSVFPLCFPWLKAEGTPIFQT